MQVIWDPNTLDLLADIQIAIENFLSQDSLLTVIQYITTALLTIFVAVAIFLVDKDSSKWIFDRKVILRYVICARVLWYPLILLTIPLLFWDISTCVYKLIFIEAVLFGAIHLLDIFYRSYRWMNVFESDGGGSGSGQPDYRMALRLLYFESVVDSKERGYEWVYIWKNYPSFSDSDRDTYLKKFISNVEELKSKGESEFQNIGAYLEGFNNNIKIIPLQNWSLFEEFFNKILEWHYSFYKMSLLPNRNSYIFYVLWHLNNIIKTVTKGIVKNGTEYTFFSCLEGHLLGKDQKYIREVVDILGGVLFEADQDELEVLFGDNFPKDWKITIKVFETTDNPVALSFFNYYQRWAYRRILDSKGEFDPKLESVTLNLFPDIDPMVWAIIFTFIVRGQNVQTYVATNQIFGFIGRLVVIDYSGDEIPINVEAQAIEDLAVVRTYKFTLKIYPTTFTIPNLTKYIAEAKALGIQDETDAEARRQAIIKVLNDLLNILQG